VVRGALSFRIGGTAGVAGWAGAVEHDEESPADARESLRRRGIPRHPHSHPLGMTALHSLAIAVGSLEALATCCHSESAEPRGRQGGRERSSSMRNPLPKHENRSVRGRFLATHTQPARNDNATFARLGCWLVGSLRKCCHSESAEPRGRQGGRERWSTMRNPLPKHENRSVGGGFLATHTPTRSE
jgi:hypothetical protein